MAPRFTLLLLTDRREAIGKRKRRAFARRFVSMDVRDKPGHDEEETLGPGSAAHHFVLRSARETRSVIQEAPQLPRP
jgi:hypothetical protein